MANSNCSDSCTTVVASKALLLRENQYFYTRTLLEWPQSTVLSQLKCVPVLVGLQVVYKNLKHEDNFKLCVLTDDKLEEKMKEAVFLHKSVWFIF